MATTKKASTVPKKTKVTVKKTVTKPKKATKVEHKTLRRSDEDTPFFTIRFTHQTLYWLILCGLVVALAAWVLHLSGKIQDIYDQIDSVETSQVYKSPNKAVTPVE